jgi:hypothetical protein
MSLRLPDTDDRIVIIGRTGSGKTYGGLWHLSMMPIDEMPFIIFDFKRDANIAQIPFANFISLAELPRTPGIHVVQPFPHDKEAITQYLYNVLDAENIGLFIDEGFMFTDDPAFDAILMQGRSKNIPVIINTQRPVRVSRFVFSEASFVQVFHVRDNRDRKTIAEFTPIFDPKNELGIDFKKSLPKYHSYYYDVSEDKLDVLGPVPKMERILKTFFSKLEPDEEDEKKKLFLPL